MKEVNRNRGTTRQLATIQTITEIGSIPEADRIEVCSILGWQVVTKKNQFKIGELSVYFEIDSLIPVTEWSSFLVDENKPDKPIRLKTRRLRHQLSQGLLMPISILEGLIKENEIIEGLDVTDILGIIKYEAAIPSKLAGDRIGDFPWAVSKTDENRIQSHPNVISEFQGEEVYFTIKMDGTSVTMLRNQDEQDEQVDQVCSRNQSLKENEHNLYWKMYYKYNIKDILRDKTTNYAIQGECCGEGIQKNRMGLKGQELFVFNVKDITANRYLDMEELKGFCIKHKLQMVPIVKVEIFGYKTVAELVEAVTVCKYPMNGACGEGWVIRTVHEKYSKALRGRASFKVINNKYLIKHGE